MKKIEWIPRLFLCFVLIGCAGEKKPDETRPDTNHVILTQPDKIEQPPIAPTNRTENKVDIPTNHLNNTNQDQTNLIAPTNTLKRYKILYPYQPQTIQLYPNGDSFAFRYTNTDYAYLQVNDSTIGGAKEFERLARSSNGLFHYYRYRSADKVYLSLNNKIYGPYDGIEPPVFSEGSTNFAFIYSNAGRTFVNHNGVSSEGYEKADHIRFNFDGSLFGYRYFFDNETFFIINGKPYGGYFKAEAPVFSRYSKSFGFWYIYDWAYFIINDKKYGGFYKIGTSAPSFSRDGSRFAFWYIKDSKKQERFVQIDDKLYYAYDNVTPVFFGYNNKDFWYAYDQSGQWYVRMNERTYEGFDALDFVFFRSGNAFHIYQYHREDAMFTERLQKTDPLQMENTENGFIGFYFRKLGKWYIRWGDRILGGYDKIEEPHISLDLSQLGFVYSNKAAFFVELNGETYGGFDKVGNLIYSEQRKSFAFWSMKDGVYTIHQNDQRTGGFDGVLDLGFSGYSFYAIVKKAGLWYLYVDNQVLGGYDQIEKPIWDIESSDFAFIYEKSGERYVYYRGKDYGAFETADILFTEDGLTLAAVKDGFCYLGIIP